MATPRFHGVIRNGVPCIEDGRFMEYCRKFADGTEVEVTVKKPRKAASNPQFRYLYGVVYKLIAEHTGHTIDEIDLMMKFKFLRCIDDHGLEFIPSKTEQSTIEQEDYAAKIRQWAAVALDLYIPMPNECEVPDYAYIN